MNFWKYQATGNDFIFVNSKPNSNSVETVRKLCERQLGIGSDGFIYLWEENKEWEWKFFNSDASISKFCGNAALCTSRLLEENFNIKNAQWKTEIGLIKSCKDKLKHCIYFPKSLIAEHKINEELLKQIYTLNERGLSMVKLIDAGVPHLVLANHDQWPIQDRLSMNLSLGKHPLLGPEGANISWYSNKGSELISFERGVDKETLGCGSGALAAYAALKETGEQSYNFPGGVLKVEESGDFYLLKGEPKLVFEGKIS